MITSSRPPSAVSACVSVSASASSASKLCSIAAFLFAGPFAALADFDGAYLPENWSDPGIADGTTSIAPASGSSTTLALAYDVDLGNPGPGVTGRTAIAPDTRLLRS